MEARKRFVGFQDHYPVPDKNGLAELETELECNIGEAEAFSLIGEVRFLNQWFYEVRSLDSRPGGKFFYIDQNGIQCEGVCTSYRPGREVSLLSDHFGEFLGQVKKVEGKVYLRIQFKNIGDDPESKSALFKSFVTRLHELTW